MSHLIAVYRSYLHVVTSTSADGYCIRLSCLLLFWRSFYWEIISKQLNPADMFSILGTSRDSAITKHNPSLLIKITTLSYLDCLEAFNTISHQLFWMPLSWLDEGVASSPEVVHLGAPQGLCPRTYAVLFKLSVLEFAADYWLRGYLKSLVFRVYELKDNITECCV